MLSSKGKTATKIFLIKAIITHIHSGFTNFDKIKNTECV